MLSFAAASMRPSELSSRGFLHVLELSAHTPFLKGERRPTQEAQKKRRSSHESDEDADDACGLHQAQAE